MPFVTPEPVVVVAARRTPIGAFQGALAPLTAPELGAAAMNACIADTALPAGDLDQALVGCVLQAGIGQAPARRAIMAAGLPVGLPTMTINKVCGSGLASVIIGHDMIRAGSAGIVLAAGMESMSNAPYLLTKARSGYRMGHQEVLDHMFTDGLQNPYDGNMMGHFAEQTARKYGFTREMQDAFAVESVRRALAAGSNGGFAAELVPLTIKGRKGETVVERDEEPLRADIERIPTMRPAFARDGTVTAASSSSISDGAAALIIMGESEAARRGLQPLARIAGFSSHAHAPEWFTTAPIGAIGALLGKLGWAAGEVDLYEINEAFACVTMSATHELGLDPARVNIHGGACALGHPIGATGTRIIVTLLHALRRHGGRRGIASACIGGGEALALALEIP